MTTPRPAPPSRAALLGGSRPRVSAAAAWRAAALLPAALYLLLALFPPMNHDVAAVLSFAERWLAGERLYSELIDVNPPLVFLLALAPAALARWTPLGGPAAAVLCNLLLLGLAWWAAARLRRGRAEGLVEAGALSGLLPFALLVAGYDLGQRELLMASAAIPYALLAARRMEGRPTGRGLALGVTLAAALGFALKPHFLAVPFLVEAVVLLRRGPGRALRDPLPWAMAGVWLLYLASIPLLFPDYLGHVVPLVWKHYLDLGEHGPLTVLLSPPILPGVLLLALLGARALLARERDGLTLALLAAALGALLSAWVQRKGWTYHGAPVLMLGGLCGGLTLARWLDANLAPARARAPALAAALALLALLGAVRGGEAPYRQLAYGREQVAMLTDWLNAHARGERVLVLGPDIAPIYPALNHARARTTLRFMNLWLLQGTNQRCPEGGARYREPWEMSRAEFYVYRTVAEDFARAPPAALLVTRHVGIPWCAEEEFDFLAYFTRHPLFAGTFRDYREAGEIHGYRLFLRER